MEGCCTCGQVRYRLADKPLFTHCCHCRWCQRETGSAFALNAILETSKVEVLAGNPVAVEIPSESGGGQTVLRCPACQIALWSHYGTGKQLAFVRVGTLRDPDFCPPDIQIFTESAQPWATLSDAIPALPQYYRRSSYWPADSIARRQAAMDAG